MVRSRGIYDGGFTPSECNSSSSTLQRTFIPRFFSFPVHRSHKKKNQRNVGVWIARASANFSLKSPVYIQNLQRCMNCTTVKHKCGEIRIFAQRGCMGHGQFGFVFRFLSSFFVFFSPLFSTASKSLRRSFILL
jgi:hypothetical protein